MRLAAQLGQAENSYSGDHAAKERLKADAVRFNRIGDSGIRGFGGLR